MKKYRELNWLGGFSRMDLKGFGRWLLATIILDLIIGRMNMEMVDGGWIFAPGFIIYVICIILYGNGYNLLTNRPQFIGGLPYTSKQEVNRCIALIVASFLSIAAIFLSIYAGIILGLYCSHNGVPDFQLSIQNLVFSFAYYLFVTALLFPLTMIQDKKKWYITFAGIAVIIAAVSLIFINLMPGEGFRTAGWVFRNVEKLPSCNLVIGVMMVVAVGAMLASYHIVQKMHAPKRYT